MNVLQTAKSVGKGVLTAAEKKAPTLLTVAAITGVFTTVYFSFKAAPKAKEILNEKKKDLESIEDGDNEAKRTVYIETLKELAPVCAPPVVSCGMAIACILGANTVSLKRQLALTAAYNLTNNTLKEYQESAKRIVGPKKSKQISDDVNQKAIMANAPDDKTIIFTGKGDMLCYDVMSGRYFKSNPEAIRKAVNLLNMDLMSEFYVSLNDYYSKIDLPEIKIGDLLGWGSGDGELVEVSFSSLLTPNEEPCLVVDYLVEPRWDYRVLH